VNWEAITAIGQLVGALAVVISLIYLANEVRSNTRATREASMRWVSDNYTQWVRQVSGHPDLSELFYRGIYDFESLVGVEVVRFSGLMVEVFRRSEEIYYLQLQGHLEPYVWNGLEASMRDFNGIRAFRLGGVFAPIGSVKDLRSTLVTTRDSLASEDVSRTKCGPMILTCHRVYEVRPRKDHRGVDLISDVLPFGAAVV